MVRFINFKVREQDIKRITANLFETDSPKPFAYYSVVNQMFYWELLVGPRRTTTQVEIKSLDDLDRVVFLISLGIDTKELQEMIDGNCLDTL